MPRARDTFDPKPSYSDNELTNAHPGIKSTAGDIDNGKEHTKM